MGNLNFTTAQVQQRLTQGYYDDIKAAGYTGTKAQLDALLAKAGIAMKGATASAAGGAGLVPAPGAGAQAKYLRGDGTWQTTPNSVYTHPTTAGNKHIPSGGVAGQFLKWSADGTAVWAADNNTTYAAMKAATASVSGATGLVPAPPAGAQNKFLKGDGTWAEAAGGGGSSYLDLTWINMASGEITGNGQITSAQAQAIKDAYKNHVSTAYVIHPIGGEMPSNVSMDLLKKDEASEIYGILINGSLPAGDPNNSILLYGIMVEFNLDGLEYAWMIASQVGPSAGGSGSGVKILPSGFVNLLPGSNTSAEISGFVGGVAGFNEIYNNLEYNEANPNYCTYWLGTPYGMLQASYALAQSLGNGSKEITFAFPFDAYLNEFNGRKSTSLNKIVINLASNGTFTKGSNSGTIYNCAREVFVNTSVPTADDGDNGDIWIQYTA